MKIHSIALAVSSLAGLAGAQQQATLSASDAAARDFFGQSICISGGTIIVGSSHDNAPILDQGSAYLFVANGSSWIQQAKVLPLDPASKALFGSSVSLSADTAAIGAPSRSLTTSGASQGAAYAFVRSGSAWSQQARLTASDAAPQDMFGIAVAVDGDTIAVGAPYRDEVGADSGAAYVYVRSGTNWNQQAKLVANDAAAGDQFGSCVSVQGDTIVVGAPRADGTSPDSGAAYVYVRNGSTWTLQAKLVASDPAEGDGFAHSACLSGEAVVVGAHLKDQSGIDSGCAYVFERTGTAWAQRAKLVASDASTFAYFGRSVSMISGTILVGACQDRVAGPASGSAYVFVGSGANWTQSAKLAPTASAAGDFFGSSVSVYGSTGAIGAPFQDGGGRNSGAAYAFWVSPPGTPFCAGDGSLATACPCANTGGAGRGCNNSIGSGGARLTSAGTASLANDTVSLLSTGELPTALSIFLQGTSTLGAGIVFGDGVRCVGGVLKRIGVHNASGGSVSYPVPGDLSISARSAALGDVIGAGQMRCYQTYYRDSNLAFCPAPPGNSWNVSSGQILVWSP
jgi:hypothetical protein